ncbi:hypothetical protein HZB94_04575 [Candidatus Falkowbacteria bacterium]|nr:hypothetical protein [Candidatus Falkowbacteria bacterium]
MDKKNPDSKYLILWLCVGLMAAIIIIGWVWALKFNLQKINAEIGASNKTAEQAENEVKEMFSKIEEALDKSDKVLNKSEKTIPAEGEVKSAPIEEKAPATK